MTNLIQRVVRLATEVFSRDTIIFERFNELRSLAAQITARDVQVDVEKILCNGYSTRIPVFYIEVFESKKVVVSIFVLREGARIPLHNHPDMHGMLKVLHGRLQIQSYTLLPHQGHTTMFQNSLQGQKHPLVHLDCQSEPCILYPFRQNLHEIHPVGGPAAFLDILSPPYDPYAPAPLTRDCEYFEEGEILEHENNSSDPVVELHKTEPPSDYYSDRLKYLGPKP